MVGRPFSRSDYQKLSRNEAGLYQVLGKQEEVFSVQLNGHQTSEQIDHCAMLYFYELQR